MSRLCVALCSEYPLGFQGGVSILVRTLIEDLADQIDFVTVSPDESLASLPRDIRDKVTTHIMFREGDPRHRLAERLKAAGVTIAHFHLGGTYMWHTKHPLKCPIPGVSAHGIRCLSTVHLVVDPFHGLCNESRPKWIKKALFAVAWLNRMRIYSRLACEIAVSDHDANKLKKWFIPMGHKIRRIYHSRILPESQPPALQVRSRHCPYILAVGHVAFRKGQHILAEAFSTLATDFPEWSLLIAGDVAEEECRWKIQAIAAKYRLEDRIHLLGPRDDTAELMSAAGVFVQPSLQEALGLALQEALRYGCACIGTQAGGIPELIIDGQNGLLVAPNDPDAMRSALRELISNSNLRYSLSKEAPLSAASKGMTRAAMSANHLAIYQSLGESP